MLRHAIRQRADKAKITVKSGKDNVAGVQLPVYEAVVDPTNSLKSHSHMYVGF